MTETLEKSSPPTLDTLAQLTHNPEENLKKKAHRKALTVFLAGKLIALDNKNIQAYRNMYYCNSVMQQEEQELKTSYCKNRLCLVCNAIKTANLINGYVPELRQMQQPMFMTLTIKAVKARWLRPALDRMQKDFRSIMQELNKYHGIKIRAIRKLECNHNQVADTYNPHFHLIIDGEPHADIIKKMWLMRNPRSNTKGQDIRPADEKSMIELFKYATKIFTKQEVDPRGLDIIYTAFRHKRVVQPIGIKKVVDEDAREKTTYPELTPESSVWKWSDQHYDWFNEITGECLTGYAPNKETKLLFEQLRE